MVKEEIPNDNVLSSIGVCLTKADSTSITLESARKSLKIEKRVTSREVSVQHQTNQTIEQKS
jgi:hypothetical protein